MERYGVHICNRKAAARIVRERASRITGDIGAFYDDFFGGARRPATKILERLDAGAESLRKCINSLALNSTKSSLGAGLVSEMLAAVQLSIVAAAEVGAQLDGIRRSGPGEGR
jgi:hypothetical protein